MCKAHNRRPSETSTSIIQQLGGDNQFDFLLMTFCDSIQEDSTLKSIFKGMELEILTGIMSSLIQTALEINAFDEDSRNRLVLKNYSLFELGMNTKHFERLQDHFESALRDSWVEEDLLGSCTKRFGALRTIFEEEGLDLEKTMITHRMVATRILAASTSG